MANFDTNQWYHIYYNQNKDTALMGSVLFNRTAQSGTTFFQTYDSSSPAHHWQFYLLSTDPDFYALRTKDSGHEGFLATKYSANEETAGQTVPRMIRGNVSDDSVYWRVSPKGDGTFFLSNKANKTDWHLTRKQNSLGAMTSNITGDKPYQRFSFETISAINDQQYSTVELPSATLISGPTGSASASTGSPNESGNPKNSTNGGLSTGAKVGIGVGIGLVVIILLVIGGLFLWRRARRNKSSQAIFEIESDKYNNPTLLSHELPQGEAAQYEAHGHSTVELHHNPKPVELDHYSNPAELPGEAYPPKYSR